MTTSVSKRVRIALEHPIEIDQRLYSELSMRRIKPKDRTATFSGTNMERAMAFAARLCGVPEGVIRSLDPVDAERIINAVKDRIAEVY